MIRAWIRRPRRVVVREWVHNLLSSIEVVLIGLNVAWVRLGIVVLIIH